MAASYRAPPFGLCDDRFLIAPRRNLMRPFSPLRLVASGAGLALIALVLAACGGGDSEDVSDVDAEALLQAAASRMDRVTSFHFKVDHENGVTPIVAGLGMTTAEGDVQGTDRMRIEVNARLAGTNVRVNLVILPDESYLSNPITGRWEQQDLDISQFFDPSNGVTALMRAVPDAKAVGRESIGGVDVYVLEASVDSGDLDLFVSQSQAGTPVTARVWIGVDDPLVYRVQVEGPLSPEEDDAIVRRLELSAFDEPIEITAPE